MNREEKIDRKLGNIVKVSLILMIFMVGFLFGYIGYNIAPKFTERDYKLTILEYGNETTNWNNYTFPVEDKGHYLVFEFQNLDPEIHYLLQWVIEDDDFDSWIISTVSGLYFNETDITEVFKVQTSHYFLCYYEEERLIPSISVIISEEPNGFDLIRAIPRLTNLDFFSMFVGLMTGLIIDVLYIGVGYKIKDKIKETIKNVRKTSDSS